jgi:predicted peptidase
MGMSMGGFGTCLLANRMPDRFAAISPIWEEPLPFLKTNAAKKVTVHPQGNPNIVIASVQK